MNIVIKNTRASRVILTRPEVTLLPGENNVDAEAWESNRKLKSVQLWLDKGYLVENNRRHKARPMLEDTTVVDLDELRGNVARCDKPAVLNRWAKNDSRREVHKLIDKRLRELERESNDPEETITDVEPMIQVSDDIKSKPKTKKKKSERARKNK